MKDLLVKKITLSFALSFIVLIGVYAQSPMQDFFKAEGVDLLANLAHPTNVYKSGYYEVGEKQIEVDIKYNNSVMNLKITRNGDYFTNITADDSDWLPPFLAIELMKDLIVETAFDSDSENKIVSTLEGYFKTSLIKMTGKQMACLILTLSWDSYQSNGGVKLDPRLREYSSNRPYWFDEWKRMEGISDSFGDENDPDKLSKEAKIYRVTMRYFINLSECLNEKARLKPELNGTLRTKSQFLAFMNHRYISHVSCWKSTGEDLNSKNGQFGKFLYEPYELANQRYLSNVLYFIEKVESNLSNNASSSQVNQLIELYIEEVGREYLEAIVALRG